MNNKLKRKLCIVVLVCLTLILGSLVAYPDQLDQKNRAKRPDSLIGSGVFPDNNFNKNFLHTGGRGCNSCHEDLYSLVYNNGPMKPHLFKVTYGKPDDVKYCLSCHRPALAMSGPKFGDIIHASHYYKTEFINQYNGNCFSCHVTDVKGNFVLYDEVKYDAILGGFIEPNADSTIEWLKKRGFPKGHMTGFDIDKDMKGAISFSQDVITDMKDVSKISNFRVPDEKDVKPESYKLTVKGMIKTEKTYTLADLQKKPRVEIIVTKECISNPIGGTYIANLKYAGVALHSILHEVGVLPGANTIRFIGIDGFDYALSLDLLIKRGAILGIAVNDQDLPLENGYPVVVVMPGEGGGAWVKWLGSIEISRVPKKEIPISTKDLPEFFNFNKVNSGFLVPPRDGTEVKRPVHLEGWAFSWINKPIKTLLFSGDYGKTWRACKVPEPVDPYRWVYWKFDWHPPAPGKYLLKVKAVTTNAKQQSKEDNLVLAVK